MSNPTLDLYKKTDDCVFPEPCSCDDCKEYYGIKKTALEVDNAVYSKILSNCLGEKEHTNEHE